MTIKRNKKQQELSNSKTPAKRPGTRMSMVEDWRGAGGQSLDKKSKRGNGLRDGR